MKGWLEGKTAVVTGAGRGIGKAAAELFASEGASVLVADMDEEPATLTTSALRAAGGKAHALVGDVTATDFPNRLIEITLRVFGGLDILVNNAGFTWDGTIHKMTDEQWQTIINVHLSAPFRIIRAAAPYLRETAKREIAQRGTAAARKIVNISSTSGTRGNFGQANYAAAKAGIVGLTKTLAREWGPFNIQVNCAAFGFIDTRLTQSKEAGEKVFRGNDAIALGIPTEIRNKAFEHIPLGRPGTPREAAGAVFFFACPLSDYVSGQVLEVAGGM
ncbi:MAG TPA: SDR family oxidoreductase [Terriglobia bacterium]|nr:SDR family oxidoreductase [Terriglobia bacterium]